MHTTIFINKQHEKILVKRRRLNNQLCSEKTANGPIVMNFTGLEIPSRLLDQLKNGLKTVPYLAVNKETLYKELIAEAILCCKELFKSQYDRYPTVPTKCSFDETILSIISQCSTNT